jgi:pyridoxal phosphate enzyme (YggS family)
MTIAQRIASLKDKLPENVTLVAVSKFHPAETIREAYCAGQKVFGENRVQELVAKRKLLPDDIQWHFIGALQKNKAKDLAPFIHTIHSVDSLELLQEINRQAARHSRTIRTLLEIHIATENTKHGFSPQSCRDMLSREDVASLCPNVQVCGLMGMATFTDNHDQIRQEFHTLRTLFDELKTSHFAHDNHFAELSMGMTGDYDIAISEGSTMVRIGSYIFGHRPPAP